MWNHLRSRGLRDGMSRECRGIFVRDLQAKAARLLEVGRELLAAPPFPLAVLVPLLDAGLLQTRDDRMKIIVAHVESEMAAAVRRPRRLRQLRDVFENDGLAARHLHHRDGRVPLQQRKLEKVSIEADALVEVESVEMKVIEVHRPGAVAP